MIPFLSSEDGFRCRVQCRPSLQYAARSLREAVRPDPIRRRPQGRSGTYRDLLTYSDPGVSFVADSTIGAARQYHTSVRFDHDRTYQEEGGRA